MPEIFLTNISKPDLVNEFLKKFRKVDPLDIPSNLPTSCTLDGIKAKRVSELKNFNGNEEIYIYWDDSDLLRKDKIHNVVTFWEIHEPWEDYDFCIFPRSLEWCIGFTHNNYCVLVE